MSKKINDYRVILATSIGSALLGLWIWACKKKCCPRKEPDGNARFQSIETQGEDSDFESPKNSERRQPMLCQHKIVDPVYDIIDLEN